MTDGCLIAIYVVFSLAGSAVVGRFCCCNGNKGVFHPDNQVGGSLPIIKTETETIVVQPISTSL